MEELVGDMRLGLPSEVVSPSEGCAQKMDSSTRTGTSFQCSTGGLEWDPEPGQ